MIASIAALLMLNKIGDNLSSLYTNNYTVTVNVWRAKREMQAARADILHAILEPDADETRESLEEAKDSLANMRAAFPVIRESFKGDIALVDQVDSLLQRAIVYRDQVFELIEAGKQDDAYQVMKYLAFGPDGRCPAENSRYRGTERAAYGGRRKRGTEICGACYSCNYGIEYCVCNMVRCLYF